MIVIISATAVLALSAVLQIEPKKNIASYSQDRLITISCIVQPDRAIDFEERTLQVVKSNHLQSVRKPDVSENLSIARKYISGDGLTFLIYPDWNSLSPEQKSPMHTDDIDQLIRTSRKLLLSPPYIPKQDIYLFRSSPDVNVTQIEHGIRNLSDEFGCRPLLPDVSHGEGRYDYRRNVPAESK